MLKVMQDGFLLDLRELDEAAAVGVEGAEHVVGEQARVAVGEELGVLLGELVLAEPPVRAVLGQRMMDMIIDDHYSSLLSADYDYL